MNSPVPLAPKNTEQTAAFLRAAHDSGTTQWFEQCLNLQHTARGIPALYPTAFSAQEATPQSERVGLAGAKRGMVGFSKGPNPAGHVFFVIGWKPNAPKIADNLLVWSNDVVQGNKVGAVWATYFTKYWGHQLQFFATWLNGYDFADFNAAPKPATPDRGTLGGNFLAGINDLKKSLAAHQAAGHTELVKVLQADIATMQAQYDKYHKA